MGKLILIRHGQTTMNAQKLYYGRLNPDLTDLGISQAEKARDLIKDIHYDKIYSSPLLRAKKTAEICNYLNLDINFEDDLMELDFGIFEGLKYEEIFDKYPLEMKKFDEDWKTYNYQTGESPVEMYERVVKFLKSLDFSKNNLIIAHWGVINSILSFFFSGNLDSYWKFGLKNGAVVILEGDINFAHLVKFV